jgi:hypothetical protein
LRGLTIGLSYVLAFCRKHEISRSTSAAELYTWGVTRTELPRTLTKTFWRASWSGNSAGMPAFLRNAR